MYLDAQRIYTHDFDTTYTVKAGVDADEAPYAHFIKDVGVRMRIAKYSDPSFQVMRGLKEAYQLERARKEKEWKAEFDAMMRKGDREREREERELQAMRERTRRLREITERIKNKEPLRPEDIEVIKSKKTLPASKPAEEGARVAVSGAATWCGVAVVFDVRPLGGACAMPPCDTGESRAQRF